MILTPLAAATSPRSIIARAGPGYRQCV